MAYILIVVCLCPAHGIHSDCGVLVAAYNASDCVDILCPLHREVFLFYLETRVGLERNSGFGCDCP